MKFTFHDKIGYWETKSSVCGHNVTLRIDKENAKEALTDVATQVVARITDNWTRLQKHLVKSLHATYNNAWADPSEGFPKLTKKEFLERLVLRTVTLMEEGAISLYYADSGIFGGHTVDVFWDNPDKLNKATLAG